jgi:hypothetical protein
LPLSAGNPVAVTESDESRVSNPARTQPTGCLASPFFPQHLRSKTHKPVQDDIRPTARLPSPRVEDSRLENDCDGPLIILMDHVFIVQHLHTLPGDVDDVKMIGAYRTRESALAAVERLRSQPGFRDLPLIVNPLEDEDDQGFHVDRYELDKDHWPEGYVTC